MIVRILEAHLVKLMCFLFCVFPSLIAFSQVDIQKGQDEIKLFDYQYEMALDIKDTLKFDDETLNWQPVTGVQFIDHTIAQHAFFRYRIFNHDSIDREFIMHTFLHWEKVDLYKNGTWVGRSGKTVKRSEKTIKDNFQVLPLILEAGKETELVFDVHSRINYGTKILLLSPKKILNNRQVVRLKLAFFYGALCVLFVLNLVWFWVTRARIRIAYCFYILAIVAFSSKNDNFWVFYMFPEGTHILYYFYYLNKLFLALGVGVYLWTYLGSKPVLKKARLYLLVVFGLYALQYGVELILGTSYYYHTLIVVVWAYLGILCAQEILRKEEKILLLALFVVCIGISITILQAINWTVLTHAYTAFALQYSFLIDAVFFAIITARKGKILSDEKLSLQEKFIHQLQENEQLQSKVQRELELKVDERTEEIQSKNEELKELNEQLKSQADTIMQMNEKLDLANYELKKENKTILENTISGQVLSLSEIKDLYPNRQSCLLLLKDLKWSNGFNCRKCAAESYQELPGLKGRRCTKCGASETFTAGTLFDRLRIPLEKAFYIAYLVFHDEENVKPRDLSKALELAEKTSYSFVKKCSEREKSSWESYLNTKGSS